MVNQRVNDQAGHRRRFRPWREQWVAQLSISAAALKCGVRDRWIGWDFRSQYGRLKLIANNSRFLILGAKARERFVGTLPVTGDEDAKQTNEIGMFIPLLDQIDIAGKEITTDALLLQRKLATYLVVERQAHYHFTVTGNQPTLQTDIALLFQDRKTPGFVDVSPSTKVVLKPAASGAVRRSMTASTFLMSAKSS